PRDQQRLRADEGQPDRSAEEQGPRAENGAEATGQGGLLGRPPRLAASRSRRRLADVEEDEQPAALALLAPEPGQGGLRRGGVAGHQQVEVAVLVEIDPGRAETDARDLVEAGRDRLVL